MTKNHFVKASKGEFSKTQQINYNTVLPGFDLVQMADDCNEYILTKNRLSDILSYEPPLKCPYSRGGGIYITSGFFLLLLVPLFINLVISLFVYIFILIFIVFIYLFCLLH